MSDNKQNQLEQNEKISKQEPIRILHLSDFHFREETQTDQAIILDALVEQISELVTDGQRPDLVVVTGDIAYSSFHPIWPGDPLEWLLRLEARFRLQSLVASSCELLQSRRQQTNLTIIRRPYAS